MMAALANASQNWTTSRRRSVHQRSLPYCLPQAWVRSITQGRHETSAWSQGVRDSDHHGSCLPCSTSPYWRRL